MSILGFEMIDWKAIFRPAVDVLTNKWRTASLAHEIDGLEKQLDLIKRERDAGFEAERYCQRRLMFLRLEQANVERD